MPLAIVRWNAANADTADASGTDADTRAAKGPKPSANAETQSTANDTDRSPLLPPELLSLKDRYPEQWAKLEAQRRKLARQLGQSPEPEAPAPPKPEIFHVHVDHLGTPREITDTDGHLVWTANYAAWGKTITSNPPRRILTRQGNTVAEVIEAQAEPLECNLRFQGQYADAESGLHYNRFRYYEPEVGRFASQDPISLLGGENLYRYAFNPTNWTDPLGLAPCVARQVGRTRIIGTGQVTSAGHDQLSELIANKLAMSGKFTEVYINRAYSTATGSQTVPRRLPDLIGIDSTGKAHAIEIPSPSDITRNRPLAQRNQTAMGQLPCGIQGTVTVLGYPYSAASIKAQIDALIGAVP